MTALRRIHLLGGPDAMGLRLVDADTGRLIEGVTKVELLCVPDGGALVNITQACRLTGINLEAIDAGRPLIDLPDDHPDVVSIEQVTAAVRAKVTEAFGLPPALVHGGGRFGGAPAKHALQAQLADIDEQLVAEGLPLARPITPAVPVAVVEPKVRVIPPVAPRRRRAIKESASDSSAREQAPADPAPLPDAPSEKARRAPEPEPEELPGASLEKVEPPDTPHARMVRSAFCVREREKTTQGLPLEDDLTPAEKVELAKLLAARGPAPTTINTPWLFPPSQPSKES